MRLLFYTVMLILGFAIMYHSIVSLVGWGAFYGGCLAGILFCTSGTGLGDEFSRESGKNNKNGIRS
jgi:hypothetical protein